MQRSNKTSKRKSLRTDPHVASLLENITDGKKVLKLRKNTTVFSQGAPAQAIYFIQTGKVKITVVSIYGKEAVLAILGPDDFLGEGCLVGQSLRVSTATTLESSTIWQIEKQSILRSFHARPELSEKFIAFLLVRNMDLEKDLCDQLFNHSEKRLARVLLKLARFGQHDTLADAKIPQLNHAILAEMVGTARLRVTHFINKFRKLALIDVDSNGEITVKADLLTDVVLHD